MVNRRRLGASCVGDGGALTTDSLRPDSGGGGDFVTGPFFNAIGKP